MESPHKRVKLSPPDTMQANEDFVPLGGDDDEEYIEPASNTPPTNAPTGPRRKAGNWGEGARHDPRNAKDRPKTKHALPGHEPWILIRTKYARRFAHNTVTKESLWRIPHELMVGVHELERGEKEQQERAQNSQWAEEQLKETRPKSKAVEVNAAADNEEHRKRRRRSESLQREDEEAMMAELAAQAEQAEERDAKEAFQAVEGKQPEGPRVGDYASDSEYEYVEVTDTEGEDHDEDEPQPEATAAPTTETQDMEPLDDQPVEFGEDDIAYQLATMGEDYGLDPGEYAEEGDDEGWEEGAEGLPLSDEDATNLFRDMLDDHHISPYTPWDKLLADESPESILMDDRYTVLPSSRLRKECWEAWSKDKAAVLLAERAAMEKRDPRIPYIAFLGEKASPKLFWPEFKRKFRKDSEMNDRKLGDKEREKFYREHISRLKLPVSTRKADLLSFMSAIPLTALNNSTTLDTLPEKLLSSLHFISLPASVRDGVVNAHITTLGPAPEDGQEETEEQQVERAKRRKREAALAERARRVHEEKQQNDRDEARARRDLREGERELQRCLPRLDNMEKHLNARRQHHASTIANHKHQIYPALKLASTMPPPDPACPILYEPTSAGITTITLNRPHVKNAINGSPTATLLRNAFLAFEDDPSQKVCIFTGAGDSFCAGFDLHHLTSTQSTSKSSNASSTEASKVDGRNLAPMGPSRMLISKPVIAAISGYAVAGGLELSLLADIRVVDESAIFGVFCRRWGVPLIDGGTVRLPAIVGLGRALDMVLTGRPVDAREASAMGLANYVVPRGQAVEKARSIAEVLVGFPQECVGVDRTSVYYGVFEAKGMEDALAREFERGVGVSRREGVVGAGRFSGGEGRHGRFAEGGRKARL